MADNLIFVYNSNSTYISQVMDFAHKIISPSTYACNLCKLTHGNFFVKKEWIAFSQSLPLQLNFLHKDEWEQEYKGDISYPIIFLLKENKQTVFLSSIELNKVKTTDSLISIIESKLASI